MTMPDDFKFDSRIRQRMLRRGDLTPAELTAHLETLPDLQEEHEVMSEFTQPALVPARADALDPSPAFDPLRRVGIGSPAYAASKVPSPSLAAKPAPRPVTPIAHSPAPVRPAPAPVAAPAAAAPPSSELDNGFRRLAPQSAPRIDGASELASPAVERAQKAWSVDAPSESEATPGSTLRSDPAAAEQPEPAAAATPEPVAVEPEPVAAKPSSLDEDDDDDLDDDDDDDDDDLEGDDDIEGESDDDDLDEDEDDDLDDDDDIDDEEPPTNPRGAQ